MTRHEFEMKTMQTYTELTLLVTDLYRHKHDFNLFQRVRMRLAHAFLRGVANEVSWRWRADLASSLSESLASSGK